MMLLRLIKSKWTYVASHRQFADGSSCTYIFRRAVEPENLTGRHPQAARLI